MSSISIHSAVQIVGLPDNVNGHFKVELDKLQAILTNPKYADKKICIISIAGQFRQGKSFLMNFLLTFLHHGQNWPKHFNKMNQGEGFKWKSGPERDTVGIHIWPQGFFLPSRKDTVIFLMDTQGLFDNRTSTHGNTTIFTLSTLLSSIQIINVPAGKFNRELLQMLDYFASYAHLAAKSGNEQKGKDNCFQTLLFLIRDWVNVHEFPLGNEGGENYLAKEIKNRKNSKVKELRDMGTQIWGAFEQIGCFLLPRPGKIVEEDQFTGKLEEVDVKFIHFVNELMGLFFSNEFLVPKKVGNVELKCNDFLFYFECYTQIMQTKELPEAKNMLQASAEASHMAAFAKSIEYYEEGIKKKCGGKDPLALELLDSIHGQLRSEALKIYKGAKKLCIGKQSEKQAIFLLEEEIQKHFRFYKESNNGKLVCKKMWDNAKKAEMEAENAKLKFLLEQKRRQKEEMAFLEECKKFEAECQKRECQTKEMIDDLERQNLRKCELERNREEARISYKKAQNELEEKRKEAKRRLEEAEKEEERIAKEQREKLDRIRADIRRQRGRSGNSCALL